MVVEIPLEEQVKSYSTHELLKEIGDLEGLEDSAKKYKVPHLFREYYQKRLDALRDEIKKRRGNPVL